MKRVVVDTKILISFAIRPSPDFERFFDYLAGHGVTLVSDETVAELSEVLSRPQFRKYIPQDSASDYVDWYVGISESVVVEEQVSACRDPKDDKFLSLAVAGKADCIITGDTDLLDMISYEGIPIYSAAEFLKLCV